MRTSVCAALAIAAAVVFRPAAAAEFGEPSPCGLVTRAFDGKDLESIDRIATVIKNVMYDLDEVHTKNGEPGVLAGLTDGDVFIVAAVAVEFCRQQPRMRLRDAAAKAYVGMRDMLQAIGAVK